MYKIVNLKQKQEFISQYIDLRNSYLEALLSFEVTTPGTLKWLSETDVELYGLVKDKILLGVVLIYLEKENEITFFVRTPNKGYGSKLLESADEIAKKRNLSCLWAWTKKENLSAIRAFEKNGYLKKEEKAKEYKGKKVSGYIFVKDFNQTS